MPGGIWILSSNAKLLGKIVTPERPANMAWGDEDGKTLYFTAHSSIYKVRVSTGKALNPYRGIRDARLLETSFNLV